MTSLNYRSILEEAQRTLTFLLKGEFPVCKERIFRFLLILLLFLSPLTKTYSNVFITADDLYTYNEEDMKIPVGVAPKIIIRFLTPTTDEERTAFIQQYTAISTKDASNVYGEGAYELRFLPNTSVDDILKKIRDITNSGIAEATPVFIVARREAVIEAVEITPTTQISSIFIEEEVRRLFRGINIHQVSREKGKFIFVFKDLFFFTGTDMPLNLLSFSNLLSARDDIVWLQNASPRFRFLSEEIVATLDVVPSTGTIGEKRKVVLTINIYSPEISVNENLLPSFGNKNFLPRSSNGSIQSAFFNLLGKRSFESYDDSYRKSIVLTWPFSLYAPEKEWVIGAQEIPYKKGDDRLKISSGEATFFVLSHTETDTEINDIPPPSVLQVGNFTVGQTVSQDSFPSYWFDEVAEIAGGYNKMLATSKIITRISGITIALVAFIAFLFMVKARRHAHSTQINLNEETIRAKCRRAQELSSTVTECYALLEQTVGEVLHQVFPVLPVRFSYSLVKELQDKTECFKETEMEKLTAFAKCFNSRHASNFSADTAPVSTRDISNDVEAFLMSYVTRNKEGRYVSTQ